MANKKRNASHNPSEIGFDFCIVSSVQKADSVTKESLKSTYLHLVHVCHRVSGPDIPMVQRECCVGSLLRKGTRAGFHKPEGVHTQDVTVTVFRFIGGARSEDHEKIRSENGPQVTKDCCFLPFLSPLTSFQWQGLDFSQTTVPLWLGFGYFHIGFDIVKNIGCQTGKNPSTQSRWHALGGTDVDCCSPYSGAQIR